MMSRKNCPRVQLSLDIYEPHFLRLNEPWTCTLLNATSEIIEHLIQIFSSSFIMSRRPN